MAAALLLVVGALRERPSLAADRRRQPGARARGRLAARTWPSPPRCSSGRGGAPLGPRAGWRRRARSARRRGRGGPLRRLPAAARRSTTSSASARRPSSARATSSPGSTRASSTSSRRIGCCRAPGSTSSSRRRSASTSRSSHSTPSTRGRCPRRGFFVEPVAGVLAGHAAARLFLAAVPVLVAARARRGRLASSSALGAVLSASRCSCPCSRSSARRGDRAVRGRLRQPPDHRRRGRLAVAAPSACARRRGRRGAVLAVGTAAIAFCADGQPRVQRGRLLRRPARRAARDLRAPRGRVRLGPDARGQAPGRARGARGAARRAPPTTVTTVQLAAPGAGVVDAAGDLRRQPGPAGGLGSCARRERLGRRRAPVPADPPGRRPSGPASTAAGWPDVRIDGSSSAPAAAGARRRRHPAGVRRPDAARGRVDRPDEPLPARPVPWARDGRHHHHPAAASRGSCVRACRGRRWSRSSRSRGSSSARPTSVW